MSGLIHLFQHCDYGGWLEQVTGEANKRIELAGNRQREVSSVKVKSGIWGLHCNDGRTYYLHANGGPKRDGNYPTFVDYFPNDSLTAVELQEDMSKCPAYLPPKNSAEELAWWLSGYLTYSKGKPLVTANAPTIKDKAGKPVWIRQFDEKIVPKAMESWSVTQRLYYELFRMFPPTTNQWFSLMQPGQPLNQADYAWLSGEGRTKPVFVSEAEFLLANQVFDVAPIVLAPKADSLKTAWESTLNSIVPNIKLVDPLGRVQAAVHKTLNSRISPDKPVTHMDLYDETAIAYSKVAQEWAQKRTELLNTSDPDQLNRAHQTIADTGLTRQFDIQRAWSTAVLTGGYHVVQKYFPYCDIKTRGAQLEEIKGRMRMGTKTNVDQTDTFLPVKFSPSNWADSLSTDFTPEDLTTSASTIRLKLTTARQRVLTLTDKLARSKAFQGDTDVNKSKKEYAAAQSDARQAAAALADCYFDNLATAVKLYVQYSTGGFAMDVIDKMQEKETGKAPAKKNDPEKINKAIDQVVAANKAVSSAQTRLTEAALDVVKKGVESGLAQVKDTRLEVELIQQQITAAQAEVEELEAALDIAQGREKTDDKENSPKQRALLYQLRIIAGFADPVAVVPANATAEEKAKLEAANKAQIAAADKLFTDVAKQCKAPEKKDTLAAQRTLNTTITAQANPELFPLVEKAWEAYKATGKSDRATADAYYKNLSEDEKRPLHAATIARWEELSKSSGYNSAMPSAPASSKQWMDLTFTCSQTSEDHSSSESASSSSTSWSCSFFFGSASGSSNSSDSESARMDRTVKTKIEVGMRLTKVSMERPGWFDTSILRGASKDMLLVGNPWYTQNLHMYDADTLVKATNATMPCYPVAFIIAKDVTVNMTCSKALAESMAKAHEASSASSGGCLCFSVSNSSAESSSSSASTGLVTDTGYSLKIPGPQIIGYIMEKTPMPLIEPPIAGTELESADGMRRFHEQFTEAVVKDYERNMTLELETTQDERDHYAQQARLTDGKKTEDEEEEKSPPVPANPANPPSGPPVPPANPPKPNANA